MLMLNILILFLYTRIYIYTYDVFSQVSIALYFYNNLLRLTICWMVPITVELTCIYYTQKYVCIYVRVYAYHSTKTIKKINSFINHFLFGCLITIVGKTNNCLIYFKAQQCQFGCYCLCFGIYIDYKITKINTSRLKEKLLKSLDLIDRCWYTI